MGKIDIPAAPQVSAHERPYWWMQVIPDRIQYTILSKPQNILGGLILGSTGFHSKVEKSLRVLHDTGALATEHGDVVGPYINNAALYRAWLKYSIRTDRMPSRLPNLLNDQETMTALLDFQRLACVSGSYLELPKRAAKAAFWQTAQEVVLPRMTGEEHDALG